MRFTNPDIGKLFKLEPLDCPLFTCKLMPDKQVTFLDHMTIVEDTIFLYLGVHSNPFLYNRQFHVFLAGETILACHEHLFSSTHEPIVFKGLNADGSLDGSVRNEGSD